MSFTLNNWKVTALSEVKSGSTKSGDYKRVNITLEEQADKFPNSIMLDYAKFGDNLKYFNPPKVGDVVDVEFNTSVRSYKKDGVERTFNNLSIWNIKTVEGGEAVAVEDRSNLDDDDLPF